MTGRAATSTWSAIPPPPVPVPTLPPPPPPAEPPAPPPSSAPNPSRSCGRGGRAGSGGGAVRRGCGRRAQRRRRARDLGSAASATGPVASTWSSNGRRSSIARASSPRLFAVAPKALVSRPDQARDVVGALAAQAARGPRAPPTSEPPARPGVLVAARSWRPDSSRSPAGRAIAPLSSVPRPAAPNPTFTRVFDRSSRAWLVEQLDDLEQVGARLRLRGQRVAVAERLPRDCPGCSPR